MLSTLSELNYKKMKIISTTLVFSMMLFIVQSNIAQLVSEIDGKLKATTMDTSNTDELFVVKKSDGTLAGRQFASMQPNPPNDTSRSFTNDMEFAKLLCQCGAPPFLVKSAINAGFTERELYDSGIQVSSLYKGGVSVDSLLEFGVTPQQLLFAGSDPIELFESGVDHVEMIGLTHGGGLIFYIDTNDVWAEFEGLVCTSFDQSAGTNWGCSGTDISGAEGELLKDGKPNTAEIISECSTSDIAADLCSDLTFAGFTDWFLPSINQLERMHDNLHLEGKGNFSGNSYWSSSEWTTTPATFAETLHFATSLRQEIGKSASLYVRAARRF